MKKLYSLFLWVAIFAIAMAYLESAVVVYLRAIWYPDGFVFPLKALNYHIVVTEIFREAATMVMLISIAVIAVREAVNRFAIFIYAFAIWDIFYYLFLYLLEGWPPSLFTWDILFLIPVTWVGPVIAPVINSITMILLAVLIVFYRTKNNLFKLTFIEWFLLILGSFVVIYAYTQPYMSYLFIRYNLKEILHFREHPDLIQYSAMFIPESFNWIIFSVAELLFLLAIFHMMLRMKRK
ncbi:MAG: hypothetical protein NTX61_09775 [Bacteroidetes bacterium]|nr:hypothetical protein [Bacteroidota bacterium]